MLATIWVYISDYAKLVFTELVLKVLEGRYYKEFVRLKFGFSEFEWRTIHVELAAEFKILFRLRWLHVGWLQY